MEISKPGRSVYVRMGVFYNEDTGQIHLTAPETKWLHTTVNNKPGSKRCHPNMFAKLARILKESGAPSPDFETSEIETE